MEVEAMGVFLHYHSRLMYLNSSYQILMRFPLFFSGNEEIRVGVAAKVLKLTPTTVS